MSAPRSEIKAILFDKDGTLFDFQRSWSAWGAEVLARLSDGDDALRAEAAEVIGFDGEAGRFRRDSLVIASTSGEVAEALSPVLGRSADDILRTLRDTAARSAQVPVAGIGDALRELSERYRLGVVTNDNEATARVHVEALGVTELFDMIIGYDSGHGFKPEPGPLLAFASAIGHPPEAVVMVGDSRHDLHAGRRAGMRTVGVLTGVALHDDLADLADVVLDDATRLSGWLATL